MRGNFGCVRRRAIAWNALAVLGVPPAGLGAVLYDNGPFITNPRGGTGLIAGQPISQADPFTVPGQSFVFSTTGVGATISANVSVADDFTVPAGQRWDLESVTLFAFQTSQTTPTVTSIRINLWSAAPFSAGSPNPRPDPLPQPTLAAALVLPAGPGAFVAHRESSSSTNTVRPVFAYTVPLDGLADQGVLDPETYWLEWSFEGAASPSSNVFVPLVTPRSLVSNPNARLFNALNSADTRDWFEGREGFVAGVSDGRAYELPFVLGGTVIPPPGSGVAFGLALAGRAVRRSRRPKDNRRPAGAAVAVHSR